MGKKRYKWYIAICNVCGHRQSEACIDNSSKGWKHFREYMEKVGCGWAGEDRRVKCNSHSFTFDRE